MEDSVQINKPPTQPTTALKINNASHYTLNWRKKNLNRAKLMHCTKSSGLYRNTNSIKMYEDYINNFKTIIVMGF